MPMEVVAEREVPRLHLVEPVRDIEAELAEARDAGAKLGYLQGCREAEEKWHAVLAERQPRPPASAEMLAVLEKISVLVGIRVLLATGLIGTFVMAWRAMSNPSVMSISVLVLFGLLSIGPLAWLAGRRN